MSDAVITQRRIGLRFCFEARDDALRYSARDYSGERTIEIPYESINLSQAAYVTLTATPLFRRLFGLVVLLFLMAAAISAIDLNLAIICAFATGPLSLTIIVARLTGWSNIRFKLFQLQPLPPGALGPMRVIDDAVGAEIITVIEESRKAKFRRLYATANLAVDPVHEIGRLTWLKDNDIISANEWQAEVEQVKAAAPKSEFPSESSENDQSDSVH
jgi:hypothetical protein